MKSQCYFQDSTSVWVAEMASGERRTKTAWRPSHLNIILLGGRNSGKASLGNLTLGKEEFLTRESTSCSRRVALVGRCLLTVVDTPGWWCDFSARDTPQLVKREIVASVSLCSPPGPHVFLIVVKRCSAFTEQRRRALEEHVALLGEGVWAHSMVVFTSQHAAPRRGGGADGQALGWLAERCGQRCHSVALAEGGPGSGEELRGKIQAFVEGNGWRAFEADEEALLEATEERSAVEERARQRLLRMRSHRALLRERLRPVTSIQLVLLGAKGCGKTSAVHTVLCRGHVPSSRRTTRSLASSGLVFGRRLTVVDTPGWWSNFFREESCIFDRREMLLGLSLCPPGPHVFLLLVRVDRAFTRTHQRAAQQHLDMFGANIWRRVIVVLTFGDWLGATGAERCIESEGEPLRQLVERCGNRYHVLDNRAGGDSGLQVRELIGKIEETLAGCDGGGGHYEAERGVMEQMERRRREEQERAEERRRKKEERRQRAKSQLEKLTPLTDIRVFLIGGRRTGKSSCGNTILGLEFFPTDTETTCCRQTQVAADSRSITVVDTPGCFPVTPDLLPPLAALLLVLNVSASFGDAQREALERQLGACGAAWSRTLVLFSHGDLLGDASVEQRIESEGEPLRRLLERCGDRYHVLENQRRGGEAGGGGAQVTELLELVEEMLAEERLEAAQRGHPLWGGVSSSSSSSSAAAGQQVVRLREKKVTRLRSCGHQLDHDLSRPAAAPAAQPSVSCCPSCSRTVALPLGRGPGRPGLAIVGGDLAGLSSVLLCKQRLRWTLNLPVSWFSLDDLPLRLSAEGPARWPSPRQQADLLALPPPPSGGDVSALLQPALRGRTVRRLSQSGGLQLLLDRWDGGSLQELEAFIDFYFEKVWEGAMESSLTAEEERDGWEPAPGPAADLGEAADEEEEEEEEEEEKEEVLSSIDRKLSKLELLEEIKKELNELRSNLEHSGRPWELRRRTAKDDDTLEH